MISDIELRLNQQRETINREFTHKEEWARRSNKQIVYDNQREAAVKCVTAFCEGKTNVCLVAQPGTGKTGTALEVMRLLGTHPDNNHCVDIKDMYISCGMSDKDWEEQFKKKYAAMFCA
jgi:ABC-type microcin C transport system duplicated ATPase subunit YejF